MKTHTINFSGKNSIAPISGLVVFFIIVIGLFNSLGTVGAGERGVHLRFNAVTQKIFDEGLYIKIPFIERVVKMDVKIQKVEVDAVAASGDLQTVQSTVALNFHVDPAKVADIYREVGLQYKIRIIDPALQESVKASTAKFTAEQLVTKREEVRDDIKNILSNKLASRGILVDDFNIVDFQFSQAFNNSIEAKVTAEQNALAAQNKLEQIKFEAQQRIEEAKGKAEAIRVESDALRESPQILQLRALEKWNGVMPQVVGGDSVPFINVDLQQ